MDKQQWLEAVPFYLNGTLDRQQRRLFEQKLRANPEWQVELDAWRKLADAVYQDAYNRANTLPPLTKRVYEEASSKQPRPATLLPLPPRSKAGRKRQRGSRMNKWQGSGVRMGVISAAVAAAAAGVLVVAAIILYAAVTSPNENQVAVAPTSITTTDGPMSENNDLSLPGAEATEFLLPTRSPSTAVLPPALNPPTQPPNSPDGSAAGTILQPSPLPQNNPELPGRGGGLSPGNGVESGGRSGPMPSPTQFQPNILPTAGPDEASRSSAQSSASGPAEEYAAQSLQFGAVCYIAPNSDFDVFVYNQADRESAISGTLEPGSRFLVKSQSPPQDSQPAFYEIVLQEADPVILGWVDVSQVTLYGPDDTPCPAATIAIPTPVP